MTYLFNTHLDDLAQKSSKKYTGFRCVIFTTENSFTKIDVDKDFEDFLLYNNCLGEDYIQIPFWDLVNLEPPIKDDFSIGLSPNTKKHPYENFNIAKVTYAGREQILLEEHTEFVTPQYRTSVGEERLLQEEHTAESQLHSDEKLITVNENPEIRVEYAYALPQKEGFYNRFKNKLHRYLVEVFPIVYGEIHRERTAYLICYDVKIGNKEPLKLKAFSLDWDMQEDNFHVLGLPEAYEGLSDVRFLYYNPSTTGGALNNSGYYLIALK